MTLLGNRFRHTTGREPRQHPGGWPTQYCLWLNQDELPDSRDWTGYARQTQIPKNCSDSCWKVSLINFVFVDVLCAMICFLRVTMQKGNLMNSEDINVVVFYNHCQHKATMKWVPFLQQIQPKNPKLSSVSLKCPVCLRWETKDLLKPSVPFVVHCV